MNLKWVRRAGAIASCLVVLLASLVGGWIFYLQYSGNVHTIEAGIAYRSNTLGMAQLAEVIATDQIKTIINLRGGSSNDEWYRDEAARATMSGVEMIDVSMSDADRPDPATLAHLIEVLRTAQRPILIHCKAGSDRTGLAAALFKYVVMGEAASEADAQLSMAYGHFPWFPSRTGAMDDAFWQVVGNTQPQIIASR